MTLTTTYKADLIGIGAENFRVFKEYQHFKIKPITILTGTNNSGKSTLGKLLLLLKKTYKEAHFNQLQLNSKDLNLGQLIDNYNMDSTSEKMTFMLEVNFLDTTTNHTTNCKLVLGYVAGFLQNFSIIKDQQVLVKCSVLVNSDKTNIIINQSFINFDENIIDKSKIKELLKISDTNLVNEIHEDLLKNIRTNIDFHRPNNDISLDEFDQNLITSILENAEYAIQNCCDSYEQEYEFNGDIETADIYYSGSHRLKDILSDSLVSILDKHALNLELREFVNLSYNPNELIDLGFLEALESIDDNGFENIIKDKTVSQIAYPKLFEMLQNAWKTNGILKDQINQELLYEWIVTKLKMVKRSYEKFERGHDIIDDVRCAYPKEFIKIEEGSDWGSLLRIMILVNNKWVNISTLGFGTSNLILKILQLIIVQKLMVVEEPEANLHPSLQANLADLIVASTELKNSKILHNPFWKAMDGNNNILTTFYDKTITGSRRIIETHSEYFIRRLQYLVAKNESPVTSEDVQIYYFNNPLEDGYQPDNKIIDIKILPNGELSNSFGKGFLDEADNIALELYLLKYQ